MNPKDKILGIRFRDIEKQGYDGLKLYSAARKDYKTMSEGQVVDDLQKKDLECRTRSLGVLLWMPSGLRS